MFGFYRAAACVPTLSVANVSFNVEKMLEKLEETMEYKPAIVAFPELSLTGYTCQDLFFQNRLYDAVKLGIKSIVDASLKYKAVLIFGSPIRYNGDLYNAAIVAQQGEILGITVKSYLPNYNEFYEKRWFQSGSNLKNAIIRASELGITDSFDMDYDINIGNNIIYESGNGFKFAVEICEDLWTPISPSRIYALGGAEMIVNLSASNELIAKREYRRNLIKQTSASLVCEYLYVSAGASESTQDLIFSGHSMLCENGAILNENRDYIADDYIMVADMDIEKIRSERLKMTSFADSKKMFAAEVDKLIKFSDVSKNIDESDGEYYPIAKHPFVPASSSKRTKRCLDIFDLQVGGLVKRLEITNAKPVIGVSGGMDSTLALLVAARALKKMKRPSTDLIAITMPAFGTSDRTYQNSLELIRALGTEPVIIDIKDACIQHLKDLGHSEEEKDITYENTQARERTQILMDYANMHGGLVVGTGDLSELALGWCTYNADQMSMYGVNATIPKTLVRWMIDSVKDSGTFPDCEAVLADILDTPISPELLPPDENGQITQKTEEKVGPYELHDFYLYYFMRFGFAPDKIYFLAKKAFKDIYDEETILKWLKTFIRRFFNQQFKRSCMPDGVKVGSVALSPRGDWRMPSDASSAEWLGVFE